MSDTHRQIAAMRRQNGLRGCEIESFVLRGPANNLAARRIMTLNHYFELLSDMSGIIDSLRLALTIEQDLKP